MPGGQADRRPLDQGLEVRILRGEARYARQGANLRVRPACHAESRYGALATIDSDLVDGRRGGSAPTMVESGLSDQGFATLEVTDRRGRR